MNYSKLKLLTFDVVGTLIDFEAGILGFFSQLDCEADDDTILEKFGQAESVQQVMTPDLPFTQMLEFIYERMAPEIGLSPSHSKNFRESIPLWPAFPDSIDALQRLRTHYRLVALTNADNWALNHMANTLGKPFADTVTCEDVGVNKPNPQVFAYCRGRQSVQGITLDQTMHVAQSQYHDIGVSKQLGYTTCWIERRKNEKGFGASPVPNSITTPDLHFSTLAELADAVEAAI